MNLILDWFENIIVGFGNATEWIIQPFVTLNGVQYSALALLTVGGLTAFLGVAVVKWLFI